MTIKVRVKVRAEVRVQVRARVRVSVKVKISYPCHPIKAAIVNLVQILCCTC